MGHVFLEGTLLILTVFLGSAFPSASFTRLIAFLPVTSWPPSIFFMSHVASFLHSFINLIEDPATTSFEWEFGRCSTQHHVMGMMSGMFAIIA